jgi:hypothetical protein
MNSVLMVTRFKRGLLTEAELGYIAEGLKRASDVQVKAADLLSTWVVCASTPAAATEKTIPTKTHVARNRLITTGLPTKAICLLPYARRQHLDVRHFLGRDAGQDVD